MAKWIDNSSFSHAANNRTGPFKLNNGPLQFRFDAASHINGWWCVRMFELTPGWDNNYLCTNRDIGLSWGYRPTDCPTSAKCVVLSEPTYAPEPWLWADNILCLPTQSNIELVWSYCGAVTGLPCVHLYDPVSPVAFLDNYICWKEH
ncbi:unnamed protein product [Adineta ricciae]|uniref:Uncharacterized protein n=2 Tax=Adineta ricciae TaxID=249248 RepID=A0A815W247_ADIRI|nr:unnamed protein product [Adineta ricciae]